MDIIGIVAEYNPFHAGHLHHILKTKEQLPDAPLVAVMSGYFVQRGEPAIIDKWTRALAAVRHGINLVVELPCYFATSAAPDFALGAVRLLASLGVTHLSFGSEIDSLPELYRLSKLHESDAYHERVREALRNGASYAAASLKAGAASLPNTLLAAEYLRHAKEMEPILIPRTANHSSTVLYPSSSFLRGECAAHSPEIGAHFPRSAVRAAHSSESTLLCPGSGEDPLARVVFSSAKAIRESLRSSFVSSREGEIDSQRREGRVLPDLLSSYTGLNYRDLFLERAPKGDRPIFMEDLDVPVLYAVRSTPAEALGRIRGMGEGLEHRLKKAALEARTIRELIERAGTKRYSPARIRRILLSIALQVKARDDVSAYEPDYIRVLAYDAMGRELLARQKKRGPEIITKLSKTKNDSPFLELDRKAAALYASLARDRFDEHAEIPIYVRPSGP